MILANIKYFLFWNHNVNKDFGFFKTLLYWDPVLITGLRLMSIWLLAYHLYSYHKRELQISKLNSQLVATAKQAQLDNLRAQLNPHFLFNCMNSIKSLVVENPSSARRSIDLLSDLLRSSLDQKDNELIIIKEELQLVRDYFELEKIRYENRLAYVIDVDPLLETNKIPKFSIQLLAENAIKHGVDKYIDGGAINISISLKNDFIRIDVENPGEFMPKHGNGIGLKNLKERLHLQFDGKADFTISERTKKKVVASILIPRTE
ncbi:histidine kinase [uncultured Croceitalea sp.]|uniref:sensor histidine kinase n=1 Tax=uncultured Croceitalea sp. TaxID=1798908 RepID=UPI00330669F7